MLDCSLVLSLFLFLQRKHRLFGNVWSSIRELNLTLSRTSIAPESSLLHSVKSQKKAGLHHIKKKVIHVISKSEKLNSSKTMKPFNEEDVIRLKPLTLDGSNCKQTSRVYNVNYEQ